MATQYAPHPVVQARPTAMAALPSDPLSDGASFFREQNDEGVRGEEGGARFRPIRRFGGLNCSWAAGSVRESCEGIPFNSARQY